MKKQIRNGFMIAAMVASFGLYSCGESKEKDTTKSQEDEMEMPDKSAEDLVVEDVINVEFKETTTQEAFKHYIGVKSALVASDNTEAQKHANMLLKSLKEIKAEQTLLDATQQLADATDINKQREAFSKITKGMDMVLTGAVSSGEIYKQFCPMAFEGKGDYWYSSSKEIRNPYFGDKMLKCGRVEEIIN